MRPVPETGLESRSSQAATRTSEEIFRGQMLALAAEDIEATAAHFAEDCVLIDMSAPEHPFRGRAGVRSFLTEYFAQWRIESVDVVSLLAVGDRVAAEIEVKATRRLPDSLSAASVVLRSCLIDVIGSGLIESERAYRDMRAVEAEAGVRSAGASVDSTRT